MVSFNKYQLTRLKQAATQLDPEPVRAILRLRGLLRSPKASDRVEFQKLFTKFYLNSGRPTIAFKKRYFKLLFAFDPKQAEPYAPLLRDLYTYKRPQGGHALYCSFVSKLVVTYDESRPVYDTHVRNFFGLSAPNTGSVEFRIAGFVANLNMLRATYLAWVKNFHFERVLKLAVKKNTAASELHPVRLCDLLVWTIGSQKIQ